MKSANSASRSPLGRLVNRSSSRLSSLTPRPSVAPHTLTTQETRRRFHSDSTVPQGPASRRLAGPWGTVESEWNLRRVSCVVRVWGATEGRGVSDESLELDLFTSRPKGERDAEFADFMAKSMGALHRTAFLLCGDADRADELTQHALERTYRAWPRVRQGDPLS